MSQDSADDDGREPAPAIAFRQCIPSDVSACARMAEEAWPADPSTFAKLRDLAGLEGYMAYSLARSNWTDIACVDAIPAGFLFGRIDGLPGIEAPSQHPLGELPWAVGSMLRARRDAPSLLRFLWNLELTDMKLMLNMPRADATIEMFIVGAEHRGKGLGTMLLDRFVGKAVGAGSTKVTVYTDDMLSNWQFYERKGFKRIGSFYDNITSYYSKKHCRGMVYSLDVKPG